MISAYTYGKMTIDDKTYPSDLVIYPDSSIDAHWWRDKPHQVGVDDVQDMVAERPDYLIIGTGEAGSLSVPAETQHYIQSQGVRLVFVPTDCAYEMYNALCPQKRVIGAFHLTS
jgi:hypothetical protein